MEMAMELGPTLCLTLAAFHAFTGCDYTAAFCSKGKAWPFNIFFKSQKILQVFASLTNSNDIFHNNKNVVQKFTSLTYGNSNCHSVNAARYLMFNKMYTTKKNMKNL